MSVASPDRPVALALSGGVALGAYHAGAYAALHEAGLPLRWLAGCSVGAAVAAVIAGNPPERRVEQLRRFWQLAALNPFPLTPYWNDRPPAGLPRQAYNMASALQAHLFGRPGMFHPRFLPSVGDPGLYDLTPLKDWLLELVDFDRLNSGEVRVSIGATDLLSGERVLFDTGSGARIGVEHILASSALSPLFPPVEIEGRLLVDGGLSVNLPLDLVLHEKRDTELACFVIELFARRGSRPSTLGAALSRSVDLVFGNQTRTLLEGQQRDYALRAKLRALGDRLPPEIRDDPEVAPLLAEGQFAPAVLLCLGQRADLDEAGPVKIFDYSEATLADRWRRGAEHMRRALDRLAALGDGPLPPGLTVHDV
ncbi:MAG TPA: patatin-like phospholipase family protein [Geminicoccus sp.]|uniref:patatin-like phospholipase family protein n=1 Tax=Geminicoccus sp. TaxID=2024832 RepID=UPI002C5E8235|nr:patatin-like phospholipase family protein [Geminicoccus sp.]HWL70326.1 patatin-like phospholipase family protein [Geminicoccus sp.]